MQVSDNETAQHREQYSPKKYKINSANSGNVLQICVENATKTAVSALVDALKLLVCETGGKSLNSVVGGAYIM